MTCANCQQSQIHLVSFLDQLLHDTSVTIIEAVADIFHLYDQLSPYINIENEDNIPTLCRSCLISLDACHKFWTVFVQKSTHNGLLSRLIAEKGSIVQNTDEHKVKIKEEAPVPETNETSNSQSIEYMTSSPGHKVIQTEVPTTSSPNKKTTTTDPKIILSLPTKSNNSHFSISPQAHKFSPRPVGQGRFKCPKCSYMAKVFSAVKRHMTKIHCARRKVPLSSLKNLTTPGNKNGKFVTTGGCYQCDQCPSSFAWKAEHFIHIHCEHSLEPRPKFTNTFCWRCPICSNEVKGNSKHNLIHHMMFHTRERPYNCSLCPFTSVTVGNFNKHWKSIHQKL